MSGLDALSFEEWENLCDGCARCCLVKLEDDRSGEIYYTNVACQFLDAGTCRCTVYEDREEKNPECMILTKEDKSAFQWLPTTCAYRLVDENRTLYEDPSSLSVKNKVISEASVHPEDLPDHIIDWIWAD